jgi:Skp family chaperone for outer membrane proteins
LGVVLATQNPVDIDYKGLSNIGTWFIGRLQTERDKMRILDGLDGAASAQGGKFDRGEMERTLSALGNRVFLLHSVHDDGQVIMQSRWAMSYLRGPMSRSQIKGLMAARRAEAAPPAPAGGENKPAIAARPASAARPVLPPEITQLFAPPRASDGIVFMPRLFACAQVRFTDKKLKVDDGKDISAVVEITDDAVPVKWDDAEEIEIPLDDLSKDAPPGEFAECAGPACTSKNYTKWSKDFANWVYANKRLTLFQYSNDDIDLTSKVGEEEREFRIRVQQALRETRDAAVEKLRAKFAKEFAKQEEKVRKAELAVQAKEAQAQSSKMSTVISFGSTILGSIFGGRKVVTAGNISKAATAAKSVGRTMQQSQNVENAQQNLDAEKLKLQELHDTMQAEVDAITESADAAKLQLETAEIKPTKTNISVRLVGLVWLPFARGDKGTLDKAY